MRNPQNAADRQRTMSPARWGTYGGRTVLVRFLYGRYSTILACPVGSPMYRIFAPRPARGAAGRRNRADATTREGRCGVIL